ncbi:MAG: DNA polymerase IV [Clostridiales Family XIII bacterium]|jgi:DNA polymerase-4|nr:DNA polymerase IV [Clostridiales Family XIII bacterium]
MSVIFHIDANAAYLSWAAVERLKHGETEDIRRIESAIAGDPKTRRGIILAKSDLAKALGVRTGETVQAALKKCPWLKLFAPDHDLYARYSDAMYEELSRYSPVIERFSIDECYLDYTGSEALFGPPLEVAHRLKDEMKRKLGFTVNVGVSVNKILAKMGSELEKPDRVHSLFPDEIEEKMWPLPIGNLFSVGRSSRTRLETAGIRTIGDAARADRSFIMSLIGEAHGASVHDFANGRDDSPVVTAEEHDRKGIGNSTTTAWDVTTLEEADKVLLWLSDKVGARLRKHGCYARVVSVSMRPSDFSKRPYGHQRKLDMPIHTTDAIYAEAKALFREAWKGEPVRNLGVHFNEITDSREGQISMFGVGSCGGLPAGFPAGVAGGQTSGFAAGEPENAEELDKAVDSIRERFGKDAVKRGL